MYLVKKEKNDELKRIRTKCYAEKTGFTPNYISAVLNGNLKCTEPGAKAILSVSFDISFYDKQMEKLLKEYFMEE